MSERGISEGLQLNYQVLVDNIASVNRGTDVAQRGNSVLRELIKVNRNMLNLFKGLDKAFNMLGNEMQRLGVTFRNAIFDFMSIFTTGHIYRAIPTDDVPRDPQDPDYLVKPIEFKKGLDDQFAYDPNTGIFAKFIEGFSKSFNKINESMFEFEEEDKDPSKDPSKKKFRDKSGVEASEGIEIFFKNMVQGFKKTFGKDSDDNAEDGVDASVIAKLVKGLLTLPGEFYKMGKSMTKMALLTQPLMEFFQGLLQPFQILGKIMKAFGMALGADMIPLVMQMAQSMVKVFPLLQRLIPFIFEIIAVIASWIGYAMDFTRGADDASEAGVRLIGNIPILSGEFESLNVYADNTKDSLTELSGSVDKFGNSIFDLDNNILAEFTIDPFSGKIYELETLIEGFDPNMNNINNFFDVLQNRADGLNADGSKDSGIGYGAHIGAGALVGGKTGSYFGPKGALIGAGIGAIAGGIIKWSESW